MPRPAIYKEHAREENGLVCACVCVCVRLCVCARVRFLSDCVRLCFVRALCAFVPACAHARVGVSARAAHVRVCARLIFCIVFAWFLHVCAQASLRPAEATRPRSRAQHSAAVAEKRVRRLSFHAWRACMCLRDANACFRPKPLMRAGRPRIRA